MKKYCEIIAKVMAYLTVVCIVCIIVSLIFVNSDNPIHLRNLKMGVPVLISCIIAGNIFNSIKNDYDN